MDEKMKDQGKAVEEQSKAVPKSVGDSNPAHRAAAGSAPGADAEDDAARARARAAVPLPPR